MIEKREDRIRDPTREMQTVIISKRRVKIQKGCRDNRARVVGPGKERTGFTRLEVCLDGAPKGQPARGALC